MNDLIRDFLDKVGLNYLWFEIKNNFIAASDEIAHTDEGRVATWREGGRSLGKGFFLGKDVPSDAKFTDTDTKVLQTVTGSGNTDYRPVILGYSSNGTDTPTFSTVTNTVYGAHKIYAKPSEGDLYMTTATVQNDANNRCKMIYDSTEECMKFTFA